MFRMKKNNSKKMTAIASRKIFRQCYNVIDRFASYYHEYCLCYLYQGCLREKTLKHIRYLQFHFVRYYCCVYTFFSFYSLKDLHKIKNDAQDLLKFYISIQNELSIILNVGTFEHRQLWKDEKDSYINDVLMYCIRLKFAASDFLF